jgi:hypothetical protein
MRGVLTALAATVSFPPSNFMNTATLGLFFQPQELSPQERSEKAAIRTSECKSLPDSIAHNMQCQFFWAIDQIDSRPAHFLRDSIIDIQNHHTENQETVKIAAAASEDSLAHSGDIIPVRKAPGVIATARSRNDPVSRKGSSSLEYIHSLG